MKLQTIYSGIFILMLLPLLISCGKEKLTREKASEAIISKFKFPQNESVKLGKKFLKESWMNGQLVSITYGYEYLDEATKQTIDKLVSSNVIKTVDNQEKSNNGIFDLIYLNIKLTEEGQKLLLGDNNDKYEFKACDIAFNEVTGIQMIDETKALVNYTIKRTNFTPFGNPSQNDIIEKASNFSLFDDGWRIND